MKLTLILLFVLAFGGSAFAQEAHPYPQPRPAPKKGDPLDPADVAVLTGKTAERRNYLAPYVHVSPFGGYSGVGVGPVERHLIFGRQIVRPLHPAFFVTGKSGFFTVAPLRTRFFLPLAAKHRGTVIVIGP